MGSKIRQTSARKKTAPAKKTKEFTLPTADELEQEITDYLDHRYHKTLDRAEPKELYLALATCVNSQLRDKRHAFNRLRKHSELDLDRGKHIYYISMEFLMGQSLKNNLYNLGETEMAAEIMAKYGHKMEDLYDCEPDAGLGNGGLGRLAACYMDGLASQGYDAMGFSIRYEYGLFKQKLVDGWQAEMPDNWLPGGFVWLNEKEAETVPVSFYGDYHEYWDNGQLKYSLNNPEIVEAVPYDMYISGSDSKAVCKLRLWKATASESFDMTAFNSGDFTKAQQKSNRAELISKVLYPADNIEEGKELRLKQQYFMVSASIQTILRNHYNVYQTFDNLGDKVAIHINDTHPALSVPELMRLLMDEHGYNWDDAWDLTTSCITYTNHTVLAEALEKWNEDLIRSMLPRIYSIIQEIDRRFRIEANKKFPGDIGKINYMAPIGDGKVRMANLSVIGSHRVNGVSALHSEILKDDVFHDFYLHTPDKFTNVTNGIAYRRWLCQSNPDLAKLIDTCIGPEYRKDAIQLERFINFRDDKEVQAKFQAIKRQNKVRMSNMIAAAGQKAPDPDSLFIVQAKRLHEYKRQLLNALRIISRYQMLKDNPNMDMQPETYLFAAKTAPSYYLAKHIIQLIWAIGQDIDRDPVISKKMRVLFLENYSVSMAERLMPATDISEQISLAGKEASGTGNMKMMINGALTIGTLDGANVEMQEAVGQDNIFIFGQRADEVERNIRTYNSKAIYDSDPVVRRAVDALQAGFAGHDFRVLYDYLLKSSYSIADPYMCLADFADYRRVHDELQQAYEDRPRWNHMAITNTAMSARFAADRSIRDYARDIWHTSPVL